MKIESLKSYFGYGGLDGYNAVHHYSQIQKRGTMKYTKNQCIEIWNKSRHEIEKALIDKMKQELDLNQKFYLIVPPTNEERKEIFIDPLISVVKQNFSNSLSLEGCIEKKNNEISAAKIGEGNKELLRENIVVNEDSIRRQKLNEKIPLVILDDVRSFGTTLEIISESLSWITNECYAFTILQTESVSKNINLYAAEKASTNSN
jgi:hypothetical protein